MKQLINRMPTIALVLGILLFIIASSSIVFSLLAPDPALTTSNIVQEQYSTNVSQLRTISELEDRIEREIHEQGLLGLDIPILIDDYVRNKFYHEYSVKPWHDNWVLAIVNIFIPQYLLSGNMTPDDIVRYDYGICNQQAILFQELINDFDFDYGSVRFSVFEFGHFASAVKVDEHWYYFDSNLEPEYDRTDPEVFSNIISGDQQTLTEMYGNHFLGVTDDMIVLGDINTFPASRGVLAQDMSLFLSWYGWIFLVFPSIIILYRRKRVQQTEDLTDTGPNSLHLE